MQHQEPFFQQASHWIDTNPVLKFQSREDSVYFMKQWSDNISYNTNAAKNIHQQMLFYSDRLIFNHGCYIIFKMIKFFLKIANK